MALQNPEPAPKPKRFRRKVETLVGSPLVKIFENMEYKASKLVGPKKIFLPNCRVEMNYYEREAVSVAAKSEASREQQKPTLLLCHGLGSSAKEFCAFLRLAKVPPNVRVLVPEWIGHGEDRKRAASEGESFVQPTPETLVESASEFLDILVGNNNNAKVNALGTSVGGAVLYYLRVNRPRLISRTVLMAPSLAPVLADPFIEGMLDGTNQFVAFRGREDVKDLFRNVLWTDRTARRTTSATAEIKITTPAIPHKRKKYNGKKDPVPKFLYEVFYQRSQIETPEGHFKKLQDNLLKTYILPVRVKNNGSLDDSGFGGTNSTTAQAAGPADSQNDESIYVTTTDLDRDGLRLVVWPEEDQICSYEKGKQFFGPSVASGRTTFETIPACGHCFHADGTPIYDILTPMVEKFVLDFS